MLDHNVGQARPVMKGGADMPSASKTRVELRRSIRQCYHRADVLAEIGEGQRGIR